MEILKVKKIGDKTIIHYKKGNVELLRVEYGLKLKDISNIISLIAKNEN